MSTALIITVGTTADPILKTVEEARKDGEDVTVYLVYGRPFPGQNPSPFEVAAEAKRKATESNVSVQMFEVSDPEDINVGLKVNREVLAVAAGAGRVIVNFTGGTKVLSAAAVHAALTVPLEGELILDYTGGLVRGDGGRVLRESMRVIRSERTATEEALQRVSESLRRGAYQEAALVSRSLTDLGRGGFAKKAVEALLLWDEFDYEPAVRQLQRLNEPAKALMDDRLVAPLPALVRRLVEPGNRLLAVLRPLNKIQQGPGVLEANLRDLPLLAADTLENAHRRLQEGRATDAVLRFLSGRRGGDAGTALAKGLEPLAPWLERGGNGHERPLPRTAPGHRTAA